LYVTYVCCLSPVAQFLVAPRAPSGASVGGLVLFIQFTARETRDPHLEGVGGVANTTSPVDWLKQSVSIRQYPAGHRDSVVSTLCAAAAAEPMNTPVMTNRVRKLVRMFSAPAHEVLNARINRGPASCYLCVGCTPIGKRRDRKLGTPVTRNARGVPLR
jgi:hypothetical protein